MKTKVLKLPEKVTNGLFGGIKTWKIKKKTVRYLSNRVKSYGEWPYIKPSPYTKKRFRRLIYFHGRGTIKSLKEPLAMRDSTEFWPTE